MQQSDITERLRRFRHVREYRKICTLTSPAQRSLPLCSQMVVAFRTLAECSGHTSLKQTLKYAEILEKDVRSDYDMIAIN